MILILVASIWSASNIMWGHHSNTIIKADGKGYYAHLPAVFIYKDLNFSFFDEIEAKYSNENLYYDYRKYTEGKTYNKYFAGTAFFILPFFLLAHLITLASGGVADGYSHWYSLSVSWAAIFYLFASLLLMRRILRRFKVEDSSISWSLLSIYFGTNWFYYVIVEPSMSHVYSVFLLTLFFYLVGNWAAGKGSNNFILAMLTLGFIIWVRPVNGMILFSIPLAFSSWKDLIAHIKSIFSSPKLLLSGLFVPLVVFSQLLIYKVQTGHFLIYSYEEEGFNFLHPHMFDILFSYKKGLFLYTPLLLVAFVGNISWWKQNAYKAAYSMGFFVLITYVLSSWWNWYYGGSFSSRAYIEYYIFFAIPLALLLQSAVKNWERFALKGLLILLILFCQFQTYQYRYMLIHWDNMTKEKYWDVFLDFSFLS